MKTVIVAAPHPDDETLGCGGTLLRHAAAGDAIHWLLFTEMREAYGYSPAAVRTRHTEIASIGKRFAFASTQSLGYAPAGLDTVATAQLVERVAGVMRAIGPDIVYVPFRGDAHSDHKAVFDAVAACTKWFRFPSIARVLAYETLSETDASIDSAAFAPNVFVDIAAFIDEKVALANLYASEVADFPFPRSEPAIRALAQVRGAAAGFTAAEAFMLLRERIE